MNTETLTLPELLQLTNGHPPHREDWTRDMLPDGWRPLCKGEPEEANDEQLDRGEWIPNSKAHGTIVFDACVKASKQWVHHRTTRPAPPKPAEEVAKKSIDAEFIDRIDRLLRDGNAEDFMRRVPISREELSRLLRMAACYEPLTNERDDLRARLATAEQEVSRLTRERDEARQGAVDIHERSEKHIASLHARAESAEAQLAEAKSRITELEQEYERSTNLAIRETNERNRLQKQLAAHTWTPTSTRMPTKADADENGFVWVKDNERDELHQAGYGYTGGWKFWMTPIPLPTPPESEARKEFEDRMLKEGNPTRRSSTCPEEYADTSIQWAWENYSAGWQASREGAQP